MKVSAKAEYGLRMMAHIAAAYGQGPVSLSQIAEHQGISQDFLEQVIVPLRRKGLVESVRGSRGGYRLTCKPEAISVGEILWTLEGPFVPMVCLEVDHEHQPECCGFLPVCTTRDVWMRLRDQVNQALSAITLADLLRSRRDQAILAQMQQGIPKRSRTRRRAILQQVGASEGALGDQR